MTSKATTKPQVVPMSLADYLLSHLAQECCEVAIRCTKAQMFGLDEVQPEQPYTNAERIMHELADVVATLEAMQAFQVLPELSQVEKIQRVRDKKIKAEHFRVYSEGLGRLRS